MNNEDVANLFFNEKLDQTPKDSIAAIGRKAANLLLIPVAWRAPTLCIRTDTYRKWLSIERANDKRSFLANIANYLVDTARSWSNDWPKGIIIRSSSSSEDLSQRGRWRSRKLTADFNPDIVLAQLTEIYEHYSEQAEKNDLAILIQPLTPELTHGHASNENRISATEKQWVADYMKPNEGKDKFNCQRAKAFLPQKTLCFSNLQERKKRTKRIVNLLQEFCLWVVQLDKGRAHIEFSGDNNQFYIHQIDFENDALDVGVDPRDTLRIPNFLQAEALNADAILKPIPLEKSYTKWKKVTNCATLAMVHDSGFPTLYQVTGDRVQSLTKDERSQLAEEIDKVTHGRAVCRTDWATNSTEKRINLPRTPTVSANKCLEFMVNTISEMLERGATPTEVCFIIHRFIPAVASAWASATPGSPIVKIDALWGLPDGLQYLPHDTFDYYTLEDREVENLPFKPKFIQEIENGDWEAKEIKRQTGRWRSISRAAVREIATVTQRLADKMDGAVHVMWFCNIDPTYEYGENLPWFFMQAHEDAYIAKMPGGRKTHPITCAEDIDDIDLKHLSKTVLLLSPELSVFRDDESFLYKVIEFAKTHNVPVELEGSTLAHAFYKLHQAGLTVYTSGPGHKRKRGKREFKKLVRDLIPEKIGSGGEKSVIAKIRKNDARAALLVKLLEEMNEFKEAVNPDDVLGELADLLEVLQALSQAAGITWNDVDNAATKKREKRGSFSEGIVLLETSSPLIDGELLENYRSLNLSDLSSVKYKSGEFEFSFASLMTGASHSTWVGDVAIEFGIKMTKDGIRLYLRPSGNNQDAKQLSFGFG